MEFVTQTTDINAIPIIQIARDVLRWSFVEVSERLE